MEAAYELQEAELTARQLRGSMARLTRRLRAERQAPGLSSTKLIVLGHLHRDGALTPGDLAARERLQPQSLTRVLVGLEHDGLIARVRDVTDRRQSYLTITAAGRAALEQDVCQRETWLAQAITTTLSPTERDLLGLAARLMDRLADA